MASHQTLNCILASAIAVILCGIFSSCHKARNLDRMMYGHIRSKYADTALANDTFMIVSQLDRDLLTKGETNRVMFITDKNGVFQMEFEASTGAYVTIYYMGSNPYNKVNWSEKIVDSKKHFHCGVIYAE